MIENNNNCFRVIKSGNFGGNQLDIVRFIYENYDNLPETIAFLQANPFDHCRREYLHTRMKLNRFSSLETYSDLKDVWGRRRSLEIDQGFVERNTSWYIEDNNEFLLNQNINLSCSFRSFDAFMVALFEDYKPLKWLRFCPGSQYIVEKSRCKQYSKNFWKNLYEQIPTWECRSTVWPTENFLLERALWYIFMGIYSEREQIIFPMEQSENLKEHHLKIKTQRNKSKFQVIPRLAEILQKPDLGQLFFEKLRDYFFNIKRKRY